MRSQSELTVVIIEPIIPLTCQWPVILSLFYWRHFSVSGGWSQTNLLTTGLPHFGGSSGILIE